MENSQTLTNVVLMKQTAKAVLVTWDGGTAGITKQWLPLSQIDVIDVTDLNDAQEFAKDWKTCTIILPTWLAFKVIQRYEVKKGAQS